MAEAAERTTWKKMPGRVKNEVKRDHVSIVAAGVAFYGFLAIFPALIALVTIYGIFSDPAQVEEQVGAMAGRLPSGAQGIVQSQLHSIASTSTSALGWGLLASVVAALWSASAGVKALIEGINIAYDRIEERGFVKLRGIAMLFTLGLLLVGIVSLLLASAVPPVLEALGLGAIGQQAVNIARWPVLAAIVMGSLMMLYRYAPCRLPASWSDVARGAGVATLVWLLATALLSFYVANFGSYQETYGALSGVIVLLLWLFVSGFSILLGAEINAVREARSGAQRSPA